MKLLQELFNKKIISEQKRDELQSEAETTNKTEEEVLLNNKIIGENSLFELKSKIVNIPFLKPTTEEIPLDILELIPEEAAINYKMVPLFRKNNIIGVGMVYPEDILAQNALRFLGRKENFSYEIYLITFYDLNNILKQHSNLKRETKKALEQLGKEKNEILIALAQGSSSIKVSEEAPIIKMVLVILRHAIEGRA